MKLTYERFKISKIENDFSTINEDENTNDIKNNVGKTKSFGNFGRKISKSNQERKFSLAQLTKEALPRLEYYRQSKRWHKRPSMGELHGEAEDQTDGAAQDEEKGQGHGGHIKLGWINGVMVPCLLNIWGVMLFLRLSWVVAQSGIIQSLIIIGISTVVCVITTLSLSAISTNGEVKGGGVYFIISRSLGPEFGASIGVVFAFANAVAASMNTIGFCDSLNDLLKSNGLKIVDGGLNDVRIVGTVTILLLVLICCVGMDWESKAQNFLVATIIIAIVAFLVGCAMGPMGDVEKISKGFTGFSARVLEENLFADYRFSEGLNQNFFTVFAIFFPSVTGIQAGANISGDLKNPAEAIPKGTMLALLISMTSYAVFVVFAGGAALRDASGIASEVSLVNGEWTWDFECAKNNTCEFGLQNSYSVMQLMSAWGPLIYAGCFAATLSTALTNLLSVPRLIQALGVDEIYPGFIFFSKPYGKHGEPFRGYVLVFLISAAFLLIGEINVIAPLISTFYLASYALINFCTFHAAFIKPLGWRPTFKYYNKWLSLTGFFLCVAIMFTINYIAAIITFVVIFALYLVVVYRKPNVNWGSTTQAQMFKSALSAAQKLQSVEEHVKNYHPNILVLAGDPTIRPPLIDVAHLITKHNSLMITGNILPTRIGYKKRQALLQDGRQYLAARKIKAFYNVMDGYSFEDGSNALIKATGFGKLAPNIILMGYKSHWQTCPKEEVSSYFNVLYHAFSLRMAVAILRLPNGIDFSDLQQYIEPKISYPNGAFTNPAFSDSIENVSAPALNVPRTSEIFHVDSNLNIAGMISSSSTISNNQSGLKPKLPPKIPKCDVEILYATRGGSEVPKKVMDALTVFTKKQEPKSTIDVWWLYDDGGLTMLLPYIISQRSTWQNCKLRVFALTNKILDQEQEEKNMAALLSKFRINYSSLTMLQGVTDMPSPQTVKSHEKLLKGFQDRNYPECFISETEVEGLAEKTNRQLRIHELVVKHSKEAALIVMSLPMPRKEAISAPFYMSWLEMLTSGVNCPFLLTRGNQTPVLTLYS
ncbi:bumetanide-sensitive sodium-(potassium)-chloride cotransporter [Condylostylus longicornis]|uniref:bumetanide-sensitive sodium-(potassium)-chloride cotransporter n=1 Tax=Condylostylus longicornis TaxID=2530218 RepID=UPI00244DD953|nr:bumetanide-sensitive sodium-(potassium)-chloride cotransporter [Condylostylus longicornis]